MKRKELKVLAQKMAKCERIIQDSSDKKAVESAQREIMKLSRGLKSLDDILILDEMIQDILAKD